MILYHNRYPEDLSFSVARQALSQSTDGRWWLNRFGREPWLAEGTLIFVVQSGLLWVTPHRRLGSTCLPVRHIDLAGGDPVEFAGEIRFGRGKRKRGRMVEWNDRTGHYNDPGRPMDPSVVPQLPAELYRPWELA